MIQNRYKYALVDMSYILMRNMFAASRSKEIGEYSAKDIIRITIQTLNKIPRDFGVTADKFILVYDKWDKALGGYYRTHLLKDYIQTGYKGTRVYVTPEYVEEKRMDPTVTPEELHKLELEAYFNQVKYDSKWGMIKDLGNIGVPCVGLEGWEFDDLAYLASAMLYSIDDKPSVIITKDSDLQYSLTPKMDYFKLPTGGSEPKIITYDEMWNSMPQEIKDSGISLYQYKAMLDSLGEGHNDMEKTKHPYADPTDTIIKILHGDYSFVDKREAFEKQMESFDLSKFPRLQEAQNIVLNQLGIVGKKGTIEDFHNFCNKYGINEISDKYYSDFIDRFDEKLFSNKK